MRVFTATELARMQGTQDSAMQDTCVIMAYGETTDEWGNPLPYYTARAAQACGFRSFSPQEVQEAGLVPTILAELRLPVATVLDPRDQIRITKRYGSTLATVEEYEITGPIRMGPSGIQVNLQAVTL